MSRLCLKSVHNHLYGMTTSFKSKVLLSKYRGRNRTLWTEEDHQQFNRQDQLDAIGTRLDGNELDNLAFEQDHQQLSQRTMNHITKQLRYCWQQRRALEKIFGKFDKRQKNKRKKKKKSSSSDYASPVYLEQPSTIVGAVYADLREVTELNEPPPDVNWDDHSNNSGPDDDSLRNQKCIEKQQQVVAHFASMIEGDTDKKLLLVTGPPGTGKSITVDLVKKKGKEHPRHRHYCSYHHRH